MMLIESDGLVATLRQRADDDGGHMASAGCEIQSVRFVKHNDEEPVFLECGALNDWAEIRLRPIVSDRERAVMRIVAEVRDDEGIVGQVCRKQVGGKF